ncbi:MAG: TRAP transporter substrate-binding protein DctP [Casimicrobiaceae bacterium]
MVLFLRSVAAAASVLLAIACANAQDRVQNAAQAPPELKLSTALGPAYPQGKAGQVWAALVRERSGGRLAVTHYPGATLFQRDPTREFAALRSGGIAMTVASTLAWSSHVAEFNLIALPWLAGSDAALDALLQSGVTAQLAARLEPLGIVVVAWASNGFRDLASKRPVRAPADLAGMRVRTPGLSLLDETLVALGAAPVTLSAADARRAALDDGLDAEEMTASAFRASSAAAAGFTRLQLWGAHADALVFGVNRRIWNGWSAADRELVRRSAQDAANEAVALRHRLGGDTALGELVRQGASVTRLTAAGKETFRAATRGVYERWAAVIGDDLVRQAEAAVAAGNPPR